MKTSSIISNLSSFLQSRFENRNYFACVYGSYSYGKYKQKSDIDLFIAIEKYDKNDFKKTKEFIVNLHKNNDLKLDNEVLYENKLFIDYKDLEKAVFLCGLILANNRFIVPRVIKTKKFLASIKIKRRLILNAVTSPHIYIGSDDKFYKRIKNLAERNITLLAIDMIDSSSFTIKDLIKKLYKSESGLEEEFYLGYKKYDLVKNYLKSILVKEVKTLTEKSDIIKNNNTFSITNHKSLRILKNVFKKYEHA